MKKYIIAPLKQRLSTIPVTQQHVNAWTKDWQFFFIIGVGRSGTVFLSNLLNQAPGAYVFHEPVFEDFIAEVFGHYSSKSSARYIRNFRKKEVYARMRGAAAGVYGEVNGALRCHVDALNVAFPSATFLHLVRDGRDVVRSHMSRRTMTLKNPLSLLLHPTKSDPWYKQWPKMDRFARMCWYWQEENRRLRTAIGELVQIEQILSSYDYFYEKLLKPCSIFICKEAWEVSIATPRNVTSNFQMPKWDDWTEQQKKKFKEVCGEEMIKCGYDI